MVYKSGFLIGERFELQSLAARGGMGEVWRAFDQETGVTVALKFVHSNDTSALDRFRRETRILSGLPHPNIVRYITDGTTQLGVPWLAMEWLVGRDLGDVLVHGRLGIQETIKLGIDAALALGAAHNAAIVHRDIKPKNLFLVEQDPKHTKVVDFGIALIKDRRITNIGTIIGTFGYMSPEQIENDGQDIDPRADVFCLGAVLFECLTGRRAFEGSHPMATIAKIVVADVPRVVDVRSDVPAALSDLIGRMLTKDRDDRPANGNDVALALQTIGLRTSTRPPGSGDRVTVLRTSRVPGPGSGSAVIHVPPLEAPPNFQAPQSERLSPQEKHLLFLVVAKAGPGEEAMFPASAGTKRSPGIRPEVIATMQARLDAQNDKLYELPGSALLILVQGRGNPMETASRAARLALVLSRLMPSARAAIVADRGEAIDQLPVGTMLDNVFRLVDLPAPLSENNEPAAIRIDEATSGLLDERFDKISRLGETFLRGEQETVPKSIKPYVGRDEDLATVRRRLEHAWERKSPVAVIVLGEAGAGKSRLRHELAQTFREQRSDVQVVVGRGDPVRTNSAFSLAGSALRSAVGISSGEPLEKSQERLLTFLGQYLSGEEKRLTAEILGEIVGAPFPDAGRARLHAARTNATLMAQLVEDAFLQFIKPLTEKTPLLLVLEELNWADAASLKLVGAALEKLHGYRFAVLGLAPPDLENQLPGLWARRDMQRVYLNALHQADAERLVRFVLGAKADDSIVRFIVNHGEGNAFYLEELCRAEQQGRGGVVPPSIRHMVGARIDSPALNEHARTVLRAASVFGHSAWESGIRKLIDGDNGGATVSLHQTLDLLIRHDFLEPKVGSRFAGETEYRFRHQFVREEAYARLVDADLSLGHKVAAEWLLSAGEKDPSVLAFHFERGNEKAKAASFYTKAAEQALSGGMLDAAIELAKKGRGLTRASEHAAELWAITTEAESWKSNHRAAYEAARNALQFARPGSRNHARALGSAVRSALDLDRRNEIADLLTELLTVEPESDAVLALSWAFRAVITSLLNHETAEALPYMERMKEITERAAKLDPAVTAWTLHTRAHWLRTVAPASKEALEAALELDQDSLRHFETIGIPRYLAYARVHVALDYIRLNQLEKAEEMLREGLKNEPEDSLTTVVGRTFRAELLLSRGAFETALEEAREVAQEAHDRGERHVEKRARLIEARALHALSHAKTTLHQSDRSS